ncbi:efflux RND transporter periplasmic adaptor subunit [Desulfovibrio sp. JC022]|uniref:efflux RND transporter periplasmic adaptor subunit n=1 Tax=Desulfovibrio sp. JC022 TaxID=2593642 RepID=UPI0013D2E733|nr:biotin/lipoyl-binding protein [Desulfovibrio sp. JC022]NDV24539.1 biotin/lipoyl-binding protein [Desulfovibrio sp. JC022]
MQHDTSSATALKVVSLLHQLVLEAVLAKSEQELVFRMLNRSIGLCHYDRALFFRFDSLSPSLSGISGQSEVNKNSEKAAQWISMIKELESRNKISIISKDSFTKNALESWEDYIKISGGISVLWMPIRAWGKTVGGIWLECWNGKTWSEQEMKLLSPLTMGYGGAWERLHPQRPFFEKFKALGKKKRSMTFCLFFIVLLMFLRLPLRVVAPCEVVAKEPLVVTAPLNGVVNELKVRPGDQVEVGQLLFVYDRRMVEKELNVAREQVQIIESSLDRARMQAFADPRARSEIKIFEHRLKQENSRLDLARYNVSRLEVRSEKEGIAEISDPERWRGRPVSIGERVLSVVDPDNTQIRIHIPEDDNMPFDFKRPAKIMLNVFPEKTIPALLDYVGNEIFSNADTPAGVQAEAEWVQKESGVKIGLKGTAILYGDKVSLGYWLFRKPWAAFNRFLGL